MATTQNYAILSQQDVPSKHGGMVREIRLVGLVDRQEYITWIDTTNFNHKHWTHIVANPDHGFILKDLKLKKMDNRTDVINADSKPLIAWEHINILDVTAAIADKWREQDIKKGRPNFDDLFGE